MSVRAAPQQIASFHERLRVIVEQHCRNLNAEIAAARPLFQEIDKLERPSSKLLQNAIAVSHKIAGSSGSLGFREISETAKQIEDRLEKASLAGEELPRCDRESVWRRFGELEKQVEIMTFADSELLSCDQI